MKATKKQLAEQDAFGRDVDALVKCRAITNSALEKFADRYGYAPTRVWTPLQPARFAEGELWIGCIARDREIVFPATLVLPRKSDGERVLGQRR